MGKDERMHFRLDSKAREKLKRVCELTGLDEPTAMRACIQAFVEHIEEFGEIRLPLAIVPKSEVKHPKETHFEYGFSKEGLKKLSEAIPKPVTPTVPEESTPKPLKKPPKEMRSRSSGQPNVLCPREKDIPSVRNVPMGPVVVSGPPSLSTREPNPIIPVKRNIKPTS